MNTVEPIPFETDRSKDLRNSLVSLSGITPVLDCPQLVRGWLTAGGLSLIYGPSNCGKTFFIANLAMSVAAGVEWQGKRTAGGDVVYIAAEGGTGIKNRIAAMTVARPEMCDHDRFHLLPVSVDLYGKEDVAAIANLLPASNIALIVVDTLARTIGAGDENSAKDASIFIGNLDRLREMTGAHVSVIHHSGKNAENGARGSSAIRAAVDTEIAINAERAVKCEKQRDLQIPDAIYFDLEQVVLGQDSDGESVTSAIVIETDAPKAKAKPLTGKNQVAMQALNEAIRTQGERKGGTDYPMSRKCVKLEHWRGACDAYGLTDGASPSAARTAFMRTKTSMIEKDLVRVFGDYVWEVR